MGRWIAARARARGLALSPEGADALAALVGTDTARAMGELEKLSLYAGEGGRERLGLQEVDAVVGPGRATGIFELDDALLARDPDRSVSVVRRHLLRAYPLAVIATTAPLLGLLGTVSGMIGAFDTVAMMGELGDAGALGGDISKALVTTMVGLVVAIPARASSAQQAALRQLQSPSWPS